MKVLTAVPSTEEMFNNWKELWKAILPEYEIGCPLLWHECLCKRNKNGILEVIVYRVLVLV